MEKSIFSDKNFASSSPPPYMKGVFRGVTWGGKHRGDEGEGLRREVQGRGVWGCA